MATIKLHKTMRCQPGSLAPRCGSEMGDEDALDMHATAFARTGFDTTPCTDCFELPAQPDWRPAEQIAEDSYAL